MNGTHLSPVSDLPEIVFDDPSDRGCMSCAHVSPATSDDDGDLFWECRRYPPQVIVLTDPVSGVPDPTRTYPTVDESDWCGEWEPDGPDLEDDDEG